MIKDFETYKEVQAEKRIPESTLRLLLNLDPEIDVIQGITLLEHELSVKSAEVLVMQEEIKYLRGLVEKVVNKI